MHVFEHENERAVLRESLEEAPPSREGLAPPVAGDVGLDVETGERAKVLDDPRRVGRLSDEELDCGRELSLNLVRGIRLEDAGLCLDHLGERPEGDPFAVGERAPLTPVRQLAPTADVGEQLVDEAALPDPRNADERYELGRALLANAGECLAQ